MKKKILIYGSREFGRVLKDMAVQMSQEFIGFIDDYNGGPDIIGCYDFVKKNYPPHIFEMVIGVGYNNLDARWNVYRKVLNDSYRVLTLIHEKAYVRDPKSINNGAIVMAGSIVDSNTVIGELAVLWPGAIVNHDSIIGKNTFLSPGAIVCGSSTVGDNCFIGAGAVITDHAAVPSGTFIKAGAVYSSPPG